MYLTSSVKDNQLVYVAFKKCLLEALTAARDAGTEILHCVHKVLKQFIDRSCLYFVHLDRQTKLTILELGYGRRPLRLGKRAWDLNIPHDRAINAQQGCQFLPQHSLDFQNSLYRTLLMGSLVVSRPGSRCT